jgi:glycosyltransferase involved in cell wall biosynthesis
MALKITVITPSYQQARFLPWSMRSVLKQGYEDTEYIVVDGGSTDGSREIIEGMSGRLAWWRSERDGGQAHAINKGIRASTGDVIGWVNSDDMLLPGSLQAVARAFDDPGIDAICGWGVMMSEPGRVLRRWAFPQPTAELLCQSSILFQPSVFWRRSVIDRIGLLDESYSLCLDQEYFARMAANGIVPRLVPRFLAAYRRHPATKTGLDPARGAREARTIALKYGRTASRPRTQFRTIAVRFFWHKLAIGLPPFARGTRIHDLYPPDAHDGVHPSRIGMGESRA